MYYYIYYKVSLFFDFNVSDGNFTLQSSVCSSSVKVVAPSMS